MKTSKLRCFSYDFMIWQELAVIPTAEGQAEGQIQDPRFKIPNHRINE
jgi:hypothetical protein